MNNTIKKLIVPGTFSGDILVLEETTSTNTLLLDMEQDSNCPAVIIAKKQTAGKGRLGRSFFSPEKGIYMSMLVKDNLPPNAALKLTTLAGVIACETIRDISNKDCRIKWVNDLIINKRKVAGILAQGKFSNDGTINCAVVGIGINLLPPNNGFPDDIKDKAGCVFTNGDYVPNAYEKIIAQIISCFYGELNTLDTGKYFERYKNLSLCLGKNVTIAGTNEQVYVIDIDDDCRLVTVNALGETRVLSTGEISIKL